MMTPLRYPLTSGRQAQASAVMTHGPTIQLIPNDHVSCFQPSRFLKKEPSTSYLT